MYFVQLVVGSIVGVIDCVGMGDGAGVDVLEARNLV